ncbi:hypothetical protein V5O48_009723 [Marasmius crinis-equi]|uniref:Fungal-type protein kinase domain-containing protein n=1 Tax=Marasmius crinis-equi TaxID=585013 RepID=A0ABR3FAF7_9AGAR
MDEDPCPRLGIDECSCFKAHGIPNFSQSSMSTRMQSRLHQRFLCLDEGESLERCQDPWELCQAYAHALTGWLNLYQTGHLHGDVSIRNILYSRRPIPCEPFFVSEAMLRFIADSDDSEAASGNRAMSSASSSSNSPLSIEALRASLEGDEDSLRAKTLNQIERVVRLTEQFTSEGECRAVIVEADGSGSSAFWPLKNYFNKSSPCRWLSGTPEFMSEEMRDAIKHGKEYLQSPVDDIESFVWCFLWTILFNDALKGPMSTAFYEDRRDEIKARNGSARGAAVRRIEQIVKTEYDAQRQSFLDEDELASHFRALAPVFVGLQERLLRLKFEWRRVRKRKECALKRVEEEGGSDAEYWLPRFHLFAFRGVADFLEVIWEHREYLRGFA